ncbi:hypothetical protein EXN66_Car010681 [Channa argus]|uniref:Uncharacterized protein n=1 Tax=Channa argus TaxID=215402 RepID=A0A6G1PXK5_CHAAH|nr:hypothetical protein EXN66_Car010681 [Channa argus]
MLLCDHQLVTNLIVILYSGVIRDFCSKQQLEIRLKKLRRVNQMKSPVVYNIL